LEGRQPASPKRQNADEPGSNPGGRTILEANAYDFVPYPSPFSIKWTFRALSDEVSKG
jgi:hypothetical protein